MVRARLLIGVLCAFALGACGGDDDDDGNGGTGGDGVGGNATGGTGGTTGGSGGTNVGGGGAGGTDAGAGGQGAGGCPTPVGASFRMGMCQCPSNKPDICAIEGVDTCLDLATNHDHCGTCETQCDPGSACSVSNEEPVCSEAPTEVTTVTGCDGLKLAIDGTNLYWTDSGQGTVSGKPLTGNDIIEIADTQAAPGSILVDDNGIYWLNVDDNTIMMSTIPAAPPAAPGNTVTELVAAQDSPIKGIAVGGDWLYFTQAEAIYKVATAGGAPIFIAESPAGDDVPQECPGTRPEPAVGAGLPTGLFVTEDRIFWTADSRQAVESSLLTGGPACTDGYIEIAQSQGSLLLSLINAAGTNVYWGNGERLVTTDISGCEDEGSCVGGNMTVTGTPDFDPISGFVIADTNAYFGSTGGEIYKSLVTESDAVILARDQMDPTSFVVDAGYVYWATSDCKIMTLPR